ncbi:LysR substrate-binding domain-containing protein [Streptomyces sp. M19]
MARQLRDREADFALASQPLTGPALRSAELVSEEVLLAVPHGHRLAGAPACRSPRSPGNAS